jgi:TolA-binding protein
MKNLYLIPLSLMLLVLPLSAQDSDSESIIKILKEPAKSDSSRNNFNSNSLNEKTKSSEGRVFLTQESAEAETQTNTSEETQEGNQQSAPIPDSDSTASQQPAIVQQSQSESQTPQQDSTPDTAVRGASANVQPPSPMSKDSVLLESGISLYNSGNFTAAIETLNDMRQNYPMSPLADQANMWIAKSYFKQNETEQGLDALELIPDTSGEYPSALFLAGSNYLALKDFENAKSSFYRAASLFPGHEIADDALLELTKLYQNEGNGEEALKNAVYIIKNYSETDSADDAYYLMGKIYEKDPRIKDIEKARHVFTLFIQKADSGQTPYSTSPLLVKVREDLRFINSNYFGID